MKSISKMMIAFAFIFGFVGCEKYADYIYDYSYSGVGFGAQQPVRTLVSRTGNDYLEFKIGVALAGLRENRKGYSATFEIDPDLLNTLDGADQFKQLPADWYTIESNNNTFVIPPGKFLGDCPVKIDKKKFTDDPEALTNTYALPLRLLSTTADSLIADKDYTVIVIKYIDEHSGSYYCKGTQAEWDGAAIVPGTTNQYAHVDLSKNKVRALTTLSLTEFVMEGMGTLVITDIEEYGLDHLIVKLVAGAVTLETKAGSNPIEDLMSSYNADTKTFTLNYIYTYKGKDFLVNEVLTLRQDVEKELRYEKWQKKVD